MGLQFKDGKEIDHVNGDGLDNRRCNLRIATRSQNQMNRKPKRGASSRYKGVFWSDDHKKWQSAAQLNKERYHLGFYNGEEEAAKAYNVFAAQHFGEYARLNEV